MTMQMHFQDMGSYCTLLQLSIRYCTIGRRRRMRKEKRKEKVQEKAKSMIKSPNFILKMHHFQNISSMMAISGEIL
jgi:hypothetical protein